MRMRVVLIAMFATWGCVAQRGGSGEVSSGPSSPIAAIPPPPGEEICPGGHLERSTIYLPSTDKMKCSMPVMHCLTNDMGACPSFAQRPMDWCKDGKEVDGDPIYIASADGKECRLPNPICLTRDQLSCPQIQPRGQRFCPKGKVVAGPKITKPSGIPGYDCELPNPVCLSKDPLACPQF